MTVTCTKNVYYSITDYRDTRQPSEMGGASLVDHLRYFFLVFGMRSCASVY